MAAAVKLTNAEALALISAMEGIVPPASLALAVFSALPPEKATALVNDRAAVKLTKPETVALIKAIVPLIPGETLKAKIAAVVKAARPCFDTPERFKAVTDYVVARLKAYAAGEAVTPTVAIQNDGFMRLYGRVNHWCAAGEDELRKDVTLCAALGVGYQIEMAGWGSGQTAFDGQDKLDATCAMYRKLHGWCKSAGIPLFVSITNWNITLSKYGNKGRPFASIVPAAKKLAQCVFDCGGQEWVYVQPVAETGKDKSATDFEKWCGSLFANWKLVYNGGSRPTKPAYGWPHFAVHPNKATDGGVKGGISISDTGTIIKQLAADGTLDGPGNPELIRAWIDKCKSSGAIGAGYYAFQRVKHDAEAIKACAASQPTTAQSSAVADDVDLSSAKWGGGIDGSRAKTTQKITSLSFNGKLFIIKTSAGTAAWKPIKDGCNQYSCLAVNRGGNWLASKFDWQRPENSPRDTKNIVDGYMGWKPVKGESIYYFQINLNCTERTNAVKVTWP